MEAETKVFGFVPPLLEKVGAESLAVEWALHARLSLDPAQPAVIGFKALKELMPKEGTLSVGDLEEPEAIARVQSLVDYLTPLFKRVAEWEGAVNKALKGGKDRKVGGPELRELRGQYEGVRVEDEATLSRLDGLIEAIEGWEKAAEGAMQAKDSEGLSALVADAQNKLKGFKLQRFEEVRGPDLAFGDVLTRLTRERVGVGMDFVTPCPQSINM